MRRDPERERIVAAEPLIAIVEQARAAGRTVALANGIFDLLHVGHLRYLHGAAAEADVLIVAVNSDASTRRLKGPPRPLVPESERAELLAGLAVVDWVTIFEEDDVTGLLRRLRPDVHCKGSDYTPETVPEGDVARGLGIRVAIVGDPKDHATREMIRRIRDTDQS